MSIWPPYEAFYIDSMLFNTTAAAMSVDAMAGTLEAIERGELARADVDEDAFLNNLQNIILQGASLSRFFWPVRSGHEARGEHLRVRLGVTDASPLKNRDLRNALEHFDERLDRYLQANVVGYILPRYVGPTLENDGVPAHLFRAYFFDRGVFSLLGQEHEMQPLVDEIGRIHNLLITAVENGSRLPSVDASSGVAGGGSSDPNDG
ncbi:MAG TPA: hypothetical protein VFQ76_16170 [Longimicrobiaceae bacterium]|nr:hypothetical protein [Longimicrobiaceae bacterium]